MIRKQWKDLLEVIGFVALVGSLYFLAIETRNSSASTKLNTQALEIAAYQELISNIADTNAMSIQNEETAEIMMQMRDWTEFEVDTFRVESALFRQFRHGDIAYFMFERGAIDEERLLSTLRPLPLYRETGRAFWERRKATFVRGYQSYVDELLNAGYWD